MDMIHGMLAMAVTKPSDLENIVTIVQIVQISLSVKSATRIIQPISTSLNVS